MATCTSFGCTNDCGDVVGITVVGGSVVADGFVLKPDL